MHDEQMIAGNKLLIKNSDVKNYVGINIRLPWYRSLPISTVEELNFTINGKAIARENVTLEVDGVVYTQDELHKLDNKLWFNLDVQKALIKFDEPLSVGKHKVSLLMQLRVPYVDKGPDHFDFAQYVLCEKTMTYEGRTW